MKTLLQLFCILLMLICNSEESFSQFKNFSFTGVVQGINSGKAELLLPLNDSSIIKVKNTNFKIDGGKFTVSGLIKYPYKMGLIVNDSVLSYEFFVEPGITCGRFISNEPNLLAPEIITKTNTEYLIEYLPSVKTIADSLDTWYNVMNNVSLKYHSKIPINEEDSLRIIWERLINKMDTLNYQFIQNDPKSFVGLWVLFDYVRKRGYSEIRNQSYSALDKSLKHTITGITIQYRLYGAKKLILGATFPSLELRDIQLRVQALKIPPESKYTLIDFWYSHCGPCLYEFPSLKLLYNAYHASGFEIFGISVDKKADMLDWKNAIKDNNITWPQFWDMNYLETEKLGITLFPETFLLDSTGKIIARNLSSVALEIFLKEHLE